MDIQVKNIFTMQSFFILFTYRNVLMWSSHIFWRCLHQYWTIHNNETAKCNLLSDSATPTKWIEWDLLRKLPLSFVVVVLLLVIVLMVITKIVLAASWRRRRTEQLREKNAEKEGKKELFPSSQIVIYISKEEVVYSKWCCWRESKNFAPNQGCI